MSRSGEAGRLRHRMAALAALPSVVIVAIGVAAAGALASRALGRRDRQLAEVRLVAEAAQQVLLRLVPRQAGLVRLAARLPVSLLRGPYRRRPLRGSDHIGSGHIRGVR